MTEKVATFKGDTVEKAIKRGLKALGVNREDVEIEIVDKGRNSIFKFRFRSAIVNITIKNEEFEDHEEINEQDQSQEQDHTFTMEKEDDEEASNKPPLIAVNHGELQFTRREQGTVDVIFPKIVQFYKNEFIVQDQVVSLTTEDQFRIELEKEETETEWSIKLNDQKTEATLMVEPGIRKEYKLKDHSPAKTISLEVQEKYEPNLTLTLEAVEKKLADMDIKYGINKDEILKALSSKDTDEFIIAKGREPEEGKDGWVEYKVNIEEEQKFEEREDGTIDFKDKGEIPSVEAGEIIGTIHDPIEGKPGKSVTDEEIPPKPVKEIQVRLGKSVSMNEAGNVIIAESWGRPTIEKKAHSLKVEVMPKLEHAGDVNLESGNLHFVGDIEVRGNVEDGMRVKAPGDIEIRGTTSNAEILAGKSAVLRGNIIGSNISAGYSQKKVVEKTSTLEQILEHMQEMLIAIKQIFEKNSFSAQQLKQKGIFPVIKLLIDKKFEDFSKMVREFYHDILEEEEMFDEEWQKTAKKLNEAFVMRNPKTLHNVDDFVELINEIKYLYELTQIPPDDQSSITFSSALNSEIYCSGDVTLIKKGSYNSTIYSGGFLRVQGFIKGGRIFAKNGAEIDEVGSKGGTPTYIIVPKGQTIKIKQAMADTTLQIGRKKHKLTRDEYEVVAKQNEDGYIELH